MNLLAPLGLLAALSAPAIIALWMLKLRRRRVVVPSTLLWQRAIIDQSANAPLQKLRTNLLMVLQVLAALFLALALARPVIQMNTQSSGSVLLLVDHSASMGAKDESGGTTRLEAALNTAREMVDSLASNQQAAVVSFANRATVLQTFTTDKSALREALDSIQPTDLPTVGDEALALASSLAAPVQARIHVISDGAFDSGQVSLRDQQVLEFTRVGTSGENVGITAADLRRPADHASTSTWQVFLNVHNHGKKTQGGKVEVHAGGRLVDTRSVTIPGGQSVPQIFLQSGLDSPEVEFRLVLSQDGLKADNSAYVVLQPPRKRQVLLVSAGNYFLERALRTTPGAPLELQRTDPGAWTDRLAEEADLVVFDGTCPAKHLPPGSYLFIQCLPPIPGFQRTGSLKSPGILDWDSAHPMLRYVELDDVSIQRAAAIQLPTSAQTVVEASEGPLVAAWSSNNVHGVIWAFDLFETNLPLRMAFPILTANSVDWLLRRGRQVEAQAGRSGAPLVVDLPAATKRATMTDPDGKGWELGTEEVRQSSFDRTNRVGYYRSALDSRPGPVYGVSLLDEYESRIEPSQSIATQGKQIKGVAAGENQSSNREIWSWAVLAVLAVIVLEWLIYHRRVLLS